MRISQPRVLNASNATSSQRRSGRARRRPRAALQSSSGERDQTSMSTLSPTRMRFLQPDRNAEKTESSGISAVSDYLSTDHRSSERFTMHKSRIATVVTALFTAMTIFIFCPVVHGDQVEALIEAAGKNDLTQVQSLLEKGTDVNAGDDKGVTALMIASVMGHVEVVKLLLNNGADVNVKTGTGSAALTLASVMGHLDATKLLLEKGADVNAKDGDGVTALMGTAFEGHLDVAKLLVEKGADVNIKSRDGDTALMAASAKGHTKIVEFLKAHGAKE